MMTKVSILGSTGSIGTQALEIVSLHPDRFCVQVLTAHSNLKLLYEQTCKFIPRVVVLADESQREAAKSLNWPHGVELQFGYSRVVEAAKYDDTQIVLNALVGFAGLVPSLAAIESAKVLALANKETLVAAGKLVTNLAKKMNTRIIPVDSEHSAIYQCLIGTPDRAALQKIILTASGGPFRGRTRAELKDVTLAQCLKHPNWTMGRKITIDSATMMNKGLEIIEAHWLFEVAYEQIQVVVHPQSIVHSMVEFVDGSVLSQMGLPDMRLPIQFALGLEERISSEFPTLDFSQAMSLSFDPPDILNFPAVRLAFEAGRLGKTYSCVFNAANEEAVAAFIKGRIPFLGIADTVEVVLDTHNPLDGNLLEDYADADAWARAEVIRHIRKDGELH